MFSIPRNNREFVRYILRRRRKYNKGKCLSIGEMRIEETIRKGNFYVEELLKDLAVPSTRLEPCVLEDVIIELFSFGHSIRGRLEAKLYSGVMTGLRTLHRRGLCTLSERDGKIRVIADLGVDSLNVQYQGRVTFMNIGPTITVCANVDNLEIYLTFTVNASTGRDAVLDDICIDGLKHFKIWVTGLGPFTWIVNTIISGATLVFKARINELFLGRVTHYLGKSMANYTFPTKNFVFKKTRRHEAISPKCKKLSTIGEHSVLQLSSGE